MLYGRWRDRTGSQLRTLASSASCDRVCAVPFDLPRQKGAIVAPFTLLLPAFQEVKHMPLEQELLWASLSGKSVWREALGLLREEEVHRVSLTLAADFGVEGMTPESLFDVLQTKLAETLSVRAGRSESSPAGDVGAFTFELESGARLTVEWFADTEGVTGEGGFLDVQQG